MLGCRPVREPPASDLSGKLSVHFDSVRYTKSGEAFKEGATPSAAWLVVFVFNGAVLLLLLGIVGSKVPFLAPLAHFVNRYVFGPIGGLDRWQMRAIVGALGGGAIALAKRYRYLHKPEIWNALWARGYLAISLSSNPALKCISPGGDWRVFISERTRVPR